MRRLMSLLGHDAERRSLDPDAGATLVFVAVSLAVLIGFVAFAVDFGRIYAERRELQVGAEAAAFAVARDCVGGLCAGAYDPFPISEDYADANAKDGLASVPEIDLDLGARTVWVLAETEEAGGSNFFETVFAKVIGYDGLTVSADATVTWGSPGSLATLPLIFSMCEWESFGGTFVEDGGFMHHASAALNGELPPTSGYPYADRYTTIFFHGDEEPCHESPSGQDLPGGFGWLETASACASNVNVGDWLGVDTGVSPSNGCTPSHMRALLGTVVLIPYFDDVRGTGSTAEYHVHGFGAYYLTGYHFTGQYREGSLIDGALPCNPPDHCVQGYFIGDWVAQEGGFGGPDLGVYIIKLIG